MLFSFSSDVNFVSPRPLQCGEPLSHTSSSHPATQPQLHLGPSVEPALTSQATADVAASPATTPAKPKA